MIKVGLIPAAGEGVRAYPATSFISKVMLEIGGKPLILRNIEIFRDQLKIKKIYIISGYLGDQIREYLGDGSKYGVEIGYIKCDQPSIGLARGILLARDYIRTPFVTILGDELYINSNHSEINKFIIGLKFSAICGIHRTNSTDKIKKNYSVQIDGDRILGLVEKPQIVENDLLGCGTYVLSPAIFDAIARTTSSPKTGKVEITEAINTLAQSNPGVFAFFLTGEYFNINTIEDYNYANYVFKATEFKNYRISLIIPAHNEQDSIGQVIKDFIDHVDEVFVVDNSSSDNTSEVARRLGARVEKVNLGGYGDTIKYGLDNAKGDILILVEADHSFRSKDLYKILEYMKDADMVIGTRTTRQLIEQGANMGGLLRWGNVFVGKLIELFWWNQEPRFTDVGCTYRGIWKDAYIKIRDNLLGTGPEFSPEMMIEILKARKRVIEIPISYYPRTGGKSKHSQSYRGILKTALKMLRVILRKRFIV